MVDTKVKKQHYTSDKRFETKGLTMINKNIHISNSLISIFIKTCTITSVSCTIIFTISI